MSFNNFGLSPEVVRGTQAMGFTEPTPIQLRAFPDYSGGQRFDRHRPNRHRQNGGVRAADSHVARQARRFSLSRPRADARAGRASRDRVSRLRPLHRSARRPSCMAASVTANSATISNAASISWPLRPDRLLDHLEQGTMHFRDVNILVLDEVDRMLDMGFLARCPAHR